MLILAINTASSRTGIALFKNSVLACSARSVGGNGISIKNSKYLFETCGSIKLLAHKSWPARNNEAEKLMPAIDELLSTSKFSDIGQIYVIKGPGSFTGLRVGVTVANTISYLTGAKIFAPSTFEYWHSRSELPILIYAGSGGVFLSKHSGTNPELVNLPELNSTLRSRKIKTVTGDITPDQINTLNNVKFQKLPGNFATAMRKIITQNLEKKPNFPAEKLVKPLYIKEPNISMPKAQIALK